jgi:hypothetical protein
MKPGHPTPTISASRIRCVFDVPQMNVMGVPGVIPTLARSDSGTAHSTKTFGLPPRLLVAATSRELAGVGYVATTLLAGCSLGLPGWGCVFCKSSTSFGVTSPLMPSHAT